MGNKNRYNIKQVLLTILWIAMGLSTGALLVAAIRKKDAKHCKGVGIIIKGVNNNFFVNNADILNSITAIANGNPVGKSLSSFNLSLMERELRRNAWIKSAELFFDNNEILQVNVNEREPVARIFSVAGAAFYIDKYDSVLPLSEKFSARLPVFTNFPSDSSGLSKEDKELLDQVRSISLAIQKDSFHMAMIEQVDITPLRNFEMIPKIGNQLILFGDGTEVEEKFNKLKLFYREVMVKAGWNYYSTIDLTYRGQVVAKKKDRADIKADSLRTLQLMQLIATNAEKMAGDTLQIRQQEYDHNSSDSLMIQQSRQRDEIIFPENTTSVNTTGKNQLTGEPLLFYGSAPKKNAVNQNPIPFKNQVRPVGQQPLQNQKQPHQKK